MCAFSSCHRQKESSTRAFASSSHIDNLAIVPGKLVHRLWPLWAHCSLSAFSGFSLPSHHLPLFCLSVFHYLFVCVTQFVFCIVFHSSLIAWHCLLFNWGNLAVWKSLLLLLLFLPLIRPFACIAGWERKWNGKRKLPNKARFFAAFSVLFLYFEVWLFVAVSVNLNCTFPTLSHFSKCVWLSTVVRNTVGALCVFYPSSVVAEIRHCLQVQSLSDERRKNDLNSIPSLVARHWS